MLPILHFCSMDTEACRAWARQQRSRGWPYVTIAQTKEIQLRVELSTASPAASIRSGVEPKELSHLESGPIGPIGVEFLGLAWTRLDFQMDPLKSRPVID